MCVEREGEKERGREGRMVVGGIRTAYYEENRELMVGMCVRREGEGGGYQGRKGRRGKEVSDWKWR